MTATILHASDSYAGGWTGDGEETTLGGLESTVRRALALEVDAVVHGGNLFKRPRPDGATVDAVADALSELAAADVPVLLVTGAREAYADGEAIEALLASDGIRELGAEPTTVGEVALFGVDHAGDEATLLDRLGALEPVEAYTYNVVVVNQLVWPPLREATADVSAYDLMEATDVHVDAVLAGGADAHRSWESEDFDYRVTYPGSTNPDRLDDGAPRATLLRADADGGTFERVRLEPTPVDESDRPEPPGADESDRPETSDVDESGRPETPHLGEGDRPEAPEADESDSAPPPGVDAEFEQLRRALAFEPSDLAGADAETLADLYGLAARAKRVFDDRRKELRDELVDRVEDDRRIDGRHASVNRTTRRRRTPKPDEEVLETVERAGIDRDDVLAVDASTLRDLVDEGLLAEDAVFDVEERPYVRVDTVSVEGSSD